MSVYVDRLFSATPRTAQARRHGNRWCHLMADTPQELHEFAARLGLRREWAQDVGTWRVHYVIEALESRPVCYSCLVVAVDERGGWCPDCVAHSDELDGLLTDWWDPVLSLACFEDRVVGPRLESLGYQSLEFGVGERDSFGPVTRIITGIRPSGNRFVHVFT